MLHYLWILISVVSALPCNKKNANLIGMFYPRCTSDHKWEPLQCHGSTGSCWCVDEEGLKISENMLPGQLVECKDAPSLMAPIASTDSHNSDKLQK